jgi:hypothetical protein
VDRLGALLAAEWRAYFRRLFRGGTGAKNNLVVMAIVALLVAGRYIQFLKDAAGVQLQLLAVAVFFVLAASLRNDGPLTAQSLQRFPLTDFERMAVRVFSALVPPWSWILLAYSMGIFWPLSRLGVFPTLGGIGLIVGGVAASQISIPMPQFQAKSKDMTLFGKEMRYSGGVAQNGLSLMITVAFCIYLAGGQGLQADALRAVFGILSLLSVNFPMSLFGLDGAGGMDRYGLSPLSGASIILKKNQAYFAVVAAQRLPILLLAVWRFGPLETLWTALETASLAFLVLAWGNLVSVWHPTRPDEEPNVIDGLVGAGAALLPCAAAIIILRGNAALIPAKMAGLTALTGGLYYMSLRYAGPYFSRNFDRIRTLLVG